MNAEHIERRKKINDYRRRAMSEAKPSHCILCGREKTSFCNSHSVPQLVLRRIADKGKVLQANSLIGFDLMDIDDGINSAGVFHIICDECDHRYFKDYEDEKYLLCDSPSGKMLAEIALKGILLQLNKRLVEKRLFEIAEEISQYELDLTEKREAQNLDIRDYTDEIEFYKELINRPDEECFQIVFWKVLPYVVPIATQSSFALPKDMNGQIMADVDNLQSDKRIQSIHLGVFPLSRSSLVFLFYHKRDIEYRPLKRQFRSTPDKECIQFINWVIFKHTENYFISKNARSVLDNSPKLQELSRDVQDSPNLGMFPSFLKPFYSPVGMDEIPNLLDKEYACAEVEEDDE